MLPVTVGLDLGCDFGAVEAIFLFNFILFLVLFEFVSEMYRNCAKRKRISAAISWSRKTGHLPAC